MWMKRNARLLHMALTRMPTVRLCRSIELISKLGKGVGMDVAVRLWGVIERAEAAVKARVLVDGASAAVDKGEAGEARARLDEAKAAYETAGG